MEKQDKSTAEFEPEIYCLVCRLMDWDEEKKCCLNYGAPDCPLNIRRVLGKLNVSCLVV